MANPFIGVTGVNKIEEVAWINEIISGLKLPQPYCTNVGILMSDLTVLDKDLRTAQFPNFETAYQLLAAVKHFARPVIHYSSSSELSLESQITTLFTNNDIYEKGICRSIQLNLMPSEDELYKIKEQYPDLELIIQVPMWKEAYQNYSSVLDYLKRFDQVASYFILDPSGGRGTQLSRRSLQIFKDLVHSGISSDKFVCGRIGCR